jgi:hypothetical protein
MSICVTPGTAGLPSARSSSGRGMILCHDSGAVVCVAVWASQGLGAVSTLDTRTQPGWWCTAGVQQERGCPSDHWLPTSLLEIARTESHLCRLNDERPVVSVQRVVVHFAHCGDGTVAHALHPPVAQLVSELDLLRLAPAHGEAMLVQNRQVVIG